MEVSDLLKQAADAVDSGVSEILLNIPEPETHNGYRVRLMGSRGPICTIVSGSRGRLNVRVNSRSLLKFITKNL